MRLLENVRVTDRQKGALQELGAKKTILRESQFYAPRTASQVLEVGVQPRAHIPGRLFDVLGVVAADGGSWTRS